MHSKPHSKVVLVDDAPQGPTARILKAAASLSPLGESFETITVEQAKDRLETISNDTTIFVTIPENDSPSCTSSANSVHPHAVLFLAQELAQSNGGMRVVLVLQAGRTAYTSLDTAAALLSGIAGIVDDRLLIADGILPFFLQHNIHDRRNRKLLILENQASRLQTMKNMLENWALELDSNETTDVRCFRAALALAQLERIRPLRGTRPLHSFEMLAQALNIEEPITSFRLNQGDLRKIISKLSDRLLPEEHEAFERLKLAQYARDNGFPTRQPIISGISAKDVPKRLYKACLSMDIKQFTVTKDIELWTAALPHREFSHLSKIRIVKGDQNV